MGIAFLKACLFQKAAKGSDANSPPSNLEVMRRPRCGIAQTTHPPLAALSRLPALRRDKLPYLASEAKIPA